jgi:hypothetical protein
MRCLRCGGGIDKTFLTGMGRYGKCLRCWFRWTEAEEGRPMSYVKDDGSEGTMFVDVPEGCLAVFSGRSR